MAVRDALGHTRDVDPRRLPARRGSRRRLILISHSFQGYRPSLSLPLYPGYHCCSYLFRSQIANEFNSTTTTIITTTPAAASVLNSSWGRSA